jgi:hypothetical protein
MAIGGMGMIATANYKARKWVRQEVIPEVQLR